MEIGLWGAVFWAAFFIFVGLLIAPFVSFDDWLHEKYTKRTADSVKQTVRDELVELGVIDADKA